MSTITFQCMSCDGDYDINIAHLAERPNALKCPHCGHKPRAQRAHAFAQALDDLLTAMAGLRSAVTFELNLASDELPPPYGTGQPAEEDDGSLVGLTARDGGDDDEEEDDEDDFDEEDEFEDDFDDDDDDDYDDDDLDEDEDAEEDERY